jgi:hypothetical protein
MGSFDHPPTNLMPFVAKVPLFGGVLEPLVKVVADTWTCQPAPGPVASSTVYCWPPGVVSARLWPVPVRVAAQLSEDGNVRVRAPTCESPWPA